MSRIIGSSATLLPALLAVASVFVMAGCARQLTPRLTEAETPAGCALGVSGSRVVAEDTSNGIALLFTSKDRPEEMRARAKDAAAQHGPGAHLGFSHDGHHGQGADHGLQMSQGPGARADADPIEGGARVRFVAIDSAETDALRARLRKKASDLNATTCTETGLRFHGRPVQE